MVQPFQRPLYLLTRFDELEPILRLVVRPPFVFTRLHSWASLKAELSNATQTAVCFADAVWSDGAERGISEGLRDIAHAFPGIAIVACLPVDSHQDAELLLTLQRWGVADILDLNRELSEAAVARRLSEVENVWAERLFVRVLPRSLSARARALLDTIARVAAEGGHVPEFADALGIRERTVPRWCTAAGVPNARRLFSWIRLLLAADLLDQSGRSIESIARASGYSSAASLKHATKTFLESTPTELRQRGAFAAAKEIFGYELHEAREAHRGSKHNVRSWFK